jgi:hypothetical protein
VPGRTHNYLLELSIGPLCDDDGEEVGCLEFLEGPMPGSNYVGVHAPDDVSLSCLQRILTHLGQRCAVVVMDNWNS